MRHLHAVEIEALVVAYILRHGGQIAASVVRDRFGDVAAADSLIGRIGRQFAFNRRRIGRVDDGVLQHDIAELASGLAFLERGHHFGNAARLINPLLFDDMNHLQAAPRLAGLHELVEVAIRVRVVGRMGHPNPISLRSAVLIPRDAAAKLRAIRFSEWIGQAFKLNHLDCGREGTRRLANPFNRREDFTAHEIDADAKTNQ